MSTTIVVGYDQTPHSDAALAEAAREAAMRGGRLNVVTTFVRPIPPGASSRPDADADDTACKTALSVAQHGADRARELHPELSVTPYALVGSAGKTVAQAAHGADLLVMGSRGQGGFTGMQVGSTSLRALAGACCPVLVVRGAGHRAQDRVVAAVDIDEPCDQVLDFAFDEASRRGAGLTVIHVWDEPWIVAYGQEDPGLGEDIALIKTERADRLAALVHSVQRRHPEVQPFQQIATGSAGRLLVEASARADLLVTGARRHGQGTHGMRLGPVTQTLLHHCECPVAVVPLS
jgi:nucleotide-binding universal stress UspA family protein